MKWAGGTIGVLGILLFFYLQAIGQIDIHWYDWTEVCAGTLEDPCIAIINFTANNDTYIYPGEEWKYLFGTDKEIKNIVVKRTWGKGLRTINLNKTWNEDVKYAVKFSKGNNYELHFFVYKKSPYEDVKWGFEIIDPVFKGVAKIELIDEYNSLTEGYAHMNFTALKNFTLKGEKVNGWVDKITPFAKDLTKYELRAGYNKSYEVNKTEWISNISCTNSTLWNISNANYYYPETCIDYGYDNITVITEYRINYKSFNYNKDYNLIKGKIIYLEIYGEWPLQAEFIYDWKINISGWVTPWKLWYGSKAAKWEIYKNTTSSIHLSNYTYPVNLTMGNTTHPIWAKGHIVALSNETDYLHLDDATDIEIVNTSENTELPWLIENYSDVGNDVDNVFDTDYIRVLLFDNFSVAADPNITFDDKSINDGIINLFGDENADIYASPYRGGYFLELGSGCINFGNLGTIGTTHTIEFWFRNTDAGNNNNVFGGGELSACLIRYNGGSGWELYDGSWIKEGTGDLTSDKWHHIVFIGNGATELYYLDGTLSYDFENTWSLKGAQHRWGLNLVWEFSSSTTCDDGRNVSYDNFMISDKAKSAQYVKQRYEETKYKYYQDGEKTILPAVKSVNYSVLNGSELRFRCSPDNETFSIPTDQTDSDGIFWVFNNGSGTEEVQIKYTGSIGTNWSFFVANQSDISASNISLSSSFQTLWWNVDAGVTEDIWLWYNCSFTGKQHGVTFEMQAI